MSSEETKKVSVVHKTFHSASHIPMEQSHTWESHKSKKAEENENTAEDTAEDIAEENTAEEKKSIYTSTTTTLVAVAGGASLSLLAAYFCYRKLKNNE